MEPKLKKKFDKKMDFSKKLRKIERMVNMDCNQEKIQRLLETCKEDVDKIYEL